MRTPDILQTRLGLVIRRHREKRKITQEEFADLVGLHRTYYGQVERGQQNITLWNVQRIALGLNLRTSQLLREAEDLDWDRAIKEPPKPPRRGRPPGKRTRRLG